MTDTVYISCLRDPITGDAFFPFSIACLFLQSFYCHILHSTDDAILSLEAFPLNPCHIKASYLFWVEYLEQLVWS